MYQCADVLACKHLHQVAWGVHIEDDDVQTILLAKIKPIPAVTEEAIAEAKKAMKATQKKKKVITIEVDEDDNTYDDMIVEGSSKSNKANDPTQRKPRRIEMLTADDDEDTASSTDEKSENE